MKYRVIDLINGLEHRYKEESDRHRAYELNEATEIMADRAEEAICHGRNISLAIIDTDSRVVRHVSVNMFPG